MAYPFPLQQENITLISLERTLSDALKKSRARLKPAGYQRWKITFLRAKRIPGVVQSRDSWLLFDVPLQRPAQIPLVSCRQAWALLARNASLPGGAKYVLASEDTQPHLTAEIPLDGLRQDPDRLAAFIAGVVDGIAVALGRGKCNRANQTGPEGIHALLDLADLCRDAGWSFIERSARELCVELEVSEGMRQATLVRWEDGINLWVEIASGEVDTLTGSSRRALGILLLRASSMVRMARAVLRRVNGGLAAGFEVMLPSAASAIELSHSLASLSVTCQLIGREAEILIEDSCLAEAYLAMQDAPN